MPTYDYHCPANGQVIEVSHRMSEQVTTWEALCRLRGVETGDTPAESPVERLATGGNIINATSRSAGDELPPCAAGGGCSNGMCGFK